MSSNLLETLMIAGAGAAVGIMGYRAYVKDEKSETKENPSDEEKSALEEFLAEMDAE